MDENDIIHDLGFDFIEKIKFHYPKIMDRTIPLSATGVSSWTFFDWKSKGMIPFEAENENDRVKLNLIEYVWVKATAALRQFGIAFKELSKMKDLIYNPEIFMQAIRELPEMIQHYEESKQYSTKQLQSFKRTLQFLNENIDVNSTIDKSFFTLFSATIFNMILMKDKGVLFGFKSQTENELVFTCLLQSAIVNMPMETNPYNFDHIQILLNPIVDELLEKDQLEKYSFSLGLLNSDEQKIIKAIRERNFTEIIIRLKGQDDLVIDVTEELNINGDKAIQIKKILGLNQYDEAIIKYRNEKEVYVKNKKRLN